MEVGSERVHLRNAIEGVAAREMANSRLFRLGGTLNSALLGRRID
jgi:hypothetical protein